MKCEQCRNHFNALIDDELTATLRNDVQLHLQECAACSKAMENLRAVDDRLRQLQIPQNGIPQVLSAMRSENPILSSISSDRRWPGRILPWSLFATVAASIAFALVLQPHKEPPAPIAGRLVRATGSIEVLSPGSNQWRRVDADQGVLMKNGARVRTSLSVSCEIETTDNAKLRLDETAELILHAPDRVEVVKGQIWSRACDSKTLRIDTNTPDRENLESFSMTCPSDSEFQWTVDEDQWVCQSISGRDAHWEILAFRCPVSPGERVAVDTEHNVQRSQRDSPTTKIWQLPLLAIGQTVDGELEEIVEALLVKIGSTKTGYLQERQIRQLGPAGAIPLLAYVQYDSSRDKISIRRDAMRIASDLADETAVTRLRQLRSDNDPSIAELANQALQRLE